MSVDDARFCVLRYLPAEIENAYGPHIIDPRSGEIIESHICWYHNVMNLLTKWYMTQCGPLDKRAQTMHFDDELMGQLIRFVSSLNSATLLFNFIYKYLNNKKLLRILPCQIFHLS